MSFLKSCSSKKRFRTEGMAKVGAQKAMQKYGKSQRWYHCCFCNRFHLTSKPSIVSQY